MVGIGKSPLGSLSVDVRRANLNYLLMHGCRFYASNDVPTGSGRICLVDSVLRPYEHGGRQQPLTISFVDDRMVR